MNVLCELTGIGAHIYDGANAACAKKSVKMRVVAVNVVADVIKKSLYRSADFVS